MVYCHYKKVCKCTEMGNGPMVIQRDQYLQQLIERKDNGMIKVITGIRRCGKSFLLFTIFKQHLLDSGVAADHILITSLHPHT